MIGHDPGSNFNSIDVKSKLEKIDDMKSFFKNEKQQPFEKEVKTKEKPNN